MKLQFPPEKLADMIASGLQSCMTASSELLISLLPPRGTGCLFTMTVERLCIQAKCQLLPYVDCAINIPCEILLFSCEKLDVLIFYKDVMMA